MQIHVDNSKKSLMQQSSRKSARLLVVIVGICTILFMAFVLGATITHVNKLVKESNVCFIEFSKLTLVNEMLVLLTQKKTSVFLDIVLYFLIYHVDSS